MGFLDGLGIWTVHLSDKLIVASDPNAGLYILKQVK